MKASEVVAWFELVATGAPREQVEAAAIGETEHREEEVETLRPHDPRLTEVNLSWAADADALESMQIGFVPGTRMRLDLLESRYGALAHEAWVVDRFGEPPDRLGKFERGGKRFGWLARVRADGTIADLAVQQVGDDPPLDEAEREGASDEAATG